MRVTCCIPALASADDESLAMGVDGAGAGIAGVAVAAVPDVVAALVVLVVHAECHVS